MKRRSSIVIAAVLFICIAAGIVAINRNRIKIRNSSGAGMVPSTASQNHFWAAPDTSLIPHTAAGDLIRYGRKLITNTSFYLGPNGIINHLSNGMNCENCHLDAGTRTFSNSFAGVASLYPLFRPRSGRVESVEFRINDCLERSLNGKELDSQSLEMKSIKAYLYWLGKDVPRGTKPPGMGTQELSILNRPADTSKGRSIYQVKCQTCHGKDGQGVLSPGKEAYTYPPLWGEHSYNTGAGMFRITKLAGFIKYAMPFGTRYPVSQLTDEQAWDLAAFIDSKPRPVKLFRHDWPRLDAKPFDFPFGPYTDRFSEQQHKYGPFGPIKQAKATLFALRKQPGK